MSTSGKLALGCALSFAFVLIGFTFYTLSQLPQGFKGL